MWYNAREIKNAAQVSAVARIYSGFTVMGTRAQGHGWFGELYTKIISSLRHRPPSLSWLVSPRLLLLNTSSAVVLRQEVSELLQY